MSAFLCDRTHLSAIAFAAAQLSEKIDAERVFGLLLDENLKSIGHRYPDASKISDWFEEGEAAFVWETVVASDYTACELLALVKSYEYQSCEHDAWSESTACAICTLLKVSLEPKAKAEKNVEAAKVAERQQALAALPTLYAKETAVEIRKMLRANFPACKFSVTTGRGSGVSSVDIRWADGPTPQAVESLTKGFEAGRFNGMTDCYDYDRDSALVINGKAYTAGCRYVFTQRELSAALQNRCIAQVAEYWGGVELKPVAVEEETKWGRRVMLQPEGMSRTNIRADVDIDWTTAIHRAASDRTTYTREG